MAQIELKGVTHSYVANHASLAPLDLKIENGGAFALLGPSGCGKTTLLNILSGLLRPTSGQVLFDGVDVTSSSPQQRNIAQVFQFPVMYDSMSVRDNLSFPLSNRRVPKAQIATRVSEIAALLEISAYLPKVAADLPPHIKQIVSLGRGIVRQDVSAILLDEPLTVIHPEMKSFLRRKLKQIHQELGLTFIYVTHDQTEALTFADQVLVMQAGRMLQRASPEELFEHPATPFIGHFIGSPGMNIVPCSWRDGAIWLGDDSIPWPKEPEFPARDLSLGIRPEYLRVLALPSSAPCALIPAVTENNIHLGGSRILTLKLAQGQKLKARVAEDQSYAAGTRVALSLPQDKIRLFPRGSDGEASWC